MPSYQTQPKPEIKASMDYKGAQIRASQKDKEESIRLSSSGRDATVMVSTLLEAGDKTYRSLSEDQLKTKIVEWRNWFYVNIYSMDEEAFQALNSPF